MDETPADEETPDEGAVLSPDELDITAEDAVVEIDDGRFVISPGGGQPSVPAASKRPAEPTDGVDEDPTGVTELSDEVVHRWLEDRLRAADSKYAFDVTARFEDSVSQRELFSNDVVTTFENLIIWYANHAGSDTPIEDVLGILLLESNLSVRFPIESLRSFAEAQGLDESDSLRSFFAATKQAGGIRFPPKDG